MQWHCGGFRYAFAALANQLCDDLQRHDPLFWREAGEQGGERLCCAQYGVCRVDPTVLDPSVYLLDKSAVQATGLLICRFFYFRSANGALPAQISADSPQQQAAE